MASRSPEPSTPPPPRIGTITLTAPTVLAPLAGVTNLPLRLLAREAGCGLVCSEMVSANGLAHGSAKTRRMMATVPAEQPLSIQIFGAEPAAMAAAARQAAAAGAAMVDINCGCSVRKVLKSGSGSNLMRTPELAGRIFTAVRRAIDLPLTVKMRTGWTPDGAQALELARIAADCGVDAVTVHPRTATQGFRGWADWSLIARIKRRAALPVIGNGDVRTPQDAARMLAETGCDAVMVGRAAVGNPFLFTRINALLRGEPIPEPDRAARLAVARRYVNASVDHLGEAHACRILRSRLTWFVRGLPHSTRFRQCITRLASKAQALDTIAAYEACLAAGEPFDPACSGSGFRGAAPARSLHEEKTLANPQDSA